MKMALRPREHIIGDRAEADVVAAFEYSGFACNEIRKDYGEDFFVVTHEDTSGIVEPFRIFIQVKGTDPTRQENLRWTEYVDALTVRNWVLANEMVVVVKKHLESGEARYCIPEERIEYLDIVDQVRANGPRAQMPVRCELPFTVSTPRELVKRARIRHYERLVCLCLPNDTVYRDLSRADMFAIEFMGRIGLLGNGEATEATVMRYRIITPAENYEDEPNMSANEKRAFEKSFRIVVDCIAEHSENQIVAVAFVEHCAVILARTLIRQGIE